MQSKIENKDSLITNNIGFFYSEIQYFSETKKSLIIIDKFFLSLKEIQ